MNLFVKPQINLNINTTKTLHSPSHIRKRWYYLLALQLLIAIRTHAQQYVDLLKLNASTTPLNTFDSSASKSVLNEYNADLSVPLKLSGKTTFLTGVIYENVQTKLFPNEPMQNLTALTLKLGINHKFNERFSTTLVALPKLAGNFGKLTHKDLQLGGIAIFKYAIHKNLNYRYGLYYNSERFGPFFVPLLGVYYLSKNEKFEANVMLPLSVDFNYRLIKFMNIGLNFNGQIRSFHTTNISPGLPDTYVSKSTNELFAYLKFNLRKIVLQTKIGQSFARKYRVFHDDAKVDAGFPLVYINDNRHPLNPDFSNGLIFQMVLIYRLPLK